MLMSDMTESEREAVRHLHRYFLPKGAELIEIVDMLWSGWECDHAMALVRMPDGSVRLKVLAGTDHPDSKDPLAMLEKQIMVYEQAVDDTRRFVELARKELLDE